MHDKLDHTLKDWASIHSLSSEEQHDLARRITTEAARQRYDQHRAVSVPFGSKLRYATTGGVLAFSMSAALFLIVWSVWLSPEATRVHDPVRFATFSEERIDAGEQLFSEMSRLFGEKFRWMSESNGEASVGVESLQGGVDSNADPVFIRLTVVSRSEGDDTWQTAWTTDLLVRGEERIEIAPNRDSENRLALWVYPMQDGTLAVDTDVSLDMPVRLAGRSSTIAQQNQPQEILRLCEGNVEYRILQTVKRLNGEDWSNDA